MGQARQGAENMAQQPMGSKERTTVTLSKVLVVSCRRMGGMGKWLRALPASKALAAEWHSARGCDQAAAGGGHGRVSMDKEIAGMPVVGATASRTDAYIPSRLRIGSYGHAGYGYCSAAISGHGGGHAGAYIGASHSCNCGYDVPSTSAFGGPARGPKPADT